MRLGLVIILIGILYFFRNIGLIDSISWTILWPIIVMLIGVSMVLRQECGCGGWGCKWCKWCRGVNHGREGKINGCNCDCDSCKECDDGTSRRRKV